MVILEVFHTQRNDIQNGNIRLLLTTVSLLLTDFLITLRENRLPVKIMSAVLSYYFFYSSFDDAKVAVTCVKRVVPAYRKNVQWMLKPSDQNKW